jgi:serine/threonine protein kinase
MDNKFTFGKYQTTELLGRGGFATVYKAENTILGNVVALKVLDAALATDETFVRRFLQEAQQTVRLDHPNIMRVLDLDKVDGKLFIVMEYVPGKNLRDSLTQQAVSLDQAAKIVRQIGSALDYAHSHQIVHRDVKPSNIMIRDDGQVKLADFGIAKAVEGARLTLTGTTIGTPIYMSPEQSQGAKVDGRSDIYSLGVIAFELITGQVPFQGDTAAVIYKQIHEQPPLPSSLAERAKGPMEPVLLKALAKEPINRYQTGKAFADDMITAVNEMQSKSIVTMYDETVVLIKNHQFADAIHELESLNAMHPGYQNVSKLLKQARQGLHLTEQYQKADEHLSAARKLAEEITSIDPNFPDTAKVLQSLSGKSPASSSQGIWFWIGAAAVISAYLSTTWVWVSNRRLVAATNTIMETRQQVEGVTLLFAPGIPWIVWLPLLTTILSVMLTLFAVRPVKHESQLGRPPVDRTNVLAPESKKRPSLWFMLFNWAILLAGFISSLFLIASVHNLVGPITIAAGTAIMLLASIVRFFQKR